jgi:hypothetical protein
LLECDYFPDNYFELWDIYEKYLREPGKKGIETNRKNGTGLFDPKVREKGVEKNRENGTAIFDPENRKKGTETHRNNKTGFFDPDVQKKCSESRKKPIELTKIATRDKFVFPSLKEAAMTFNLNKNRLSDVCCGRRKTTVGYTARYL